MQLSGDLRSESTGNERLTLLARSGLLDEAADAELDRWTESVRRQLRATATCLSLPHHGAIVVKSLATGGADPSASTASGSPVTASGSPVTASGSPVTARELLADSTGAAGAYMAIPVVVEGEPLALLSVADRRARTWSKAERQIAADAAAAIATVISLRLARADVARVQELVDAHDNVQQLIAHAAPLPQVMSEITASIERYDPSLIACIVLLDRGTSTLHPGAGPSLPEDYLAAIDGVVIGPNIGSCGSAAWSGELTITEDIATDPRWVPIREFALERGLRHCWSMPIKAVDETVLGTLALYGRHPRAPSPELVALQSGWAGITGVAIERDRALEQLVHDARVDALTGLANRAATFERLDSALEHAGLESPTGVMFIDLDGLKGLNDTLGHDRADEMLREVAGRLEATVREGDFVGRIGGDEFVVIAERIDDEDQASSLGQRLLEAISQPLPTLDGAVLTASIGIALFRHPDVTAREAVQQADSAMYEAKRTGRDRCVLFAGDRRVHAGRRLALARELRGVESRGELRLVFQPVWEVTAGEVVGAEALLRWESPRLGPVEPDRFIPVAEETGAIVPIGAWALRESCETMAAVIDRVGRRLELAVNISARQLGYPGLARSVHLTLAHAGLATELLTLEITETALMRRDATTARTVRELAALGVGVVLDDFGTGFSSLRWLKEHPVGGLKVDRDFVAGVADDKQDRAIVATVVDLGRRLGYRVTAKGVERYEQLAALTTLGCERAQGFLLAAPLSADELVELLRGSSAPPLAA